MSEKNILGLDLTKGVINLDLSSYSHRSSNQFQYSSPVHNIFIDQLQTSSQKFSKQEGVKHHRFGAILFRNIIRSIMMKYLRKINCRFLFKKIAYNLIVSKRKRDLQCALLSIKRYSIKTNSSILERHLQKNTQIKIMMAVLKRLEEARVLEGFQSIKDVNNKRKHQVVFLDALYQHINRALKHQYFLPFLNALKRITGRQLCISQQMPSIERIITNGQQRLVKMVFDSIFDVGFLKILEEEGSVKKGKSEELVSIGSRNKEGCSDLKQKLKSRKIEVEKQKLARNKAIQQKKKYNNTSRIAEIQVQRKFQKEFKIENAATALVEKEQLEMQRILGKRNKPSRNDQSWKLKCTTIFKLLTQHSANEIKNIYQMLPSLPADLQSFENSQEFFFKVNAKYQALVEIYEKRQNKNYEAEYYSLEHENYVIKEMIRCLMVQEYEGCMLLR